MTKLIIKATENTPQVVFDVDARRFEIRGRSFPEDTVSFYEDILNWLKDSATDRKLVGAVEIYLEYFNTGTYIRLLEIFNLCADLNNADHDLKVNWFVEENDEDSIDNAKSFLDVVHVPFNLRTLPSISYKGDQ